MMPAPDVSLYERDLQLLRVIDKHGPATLAMVGKLEARPLPPQPLRERIADLVLLRLVNASVLSRSGKQLVYSATAQGREALDVKRPTAAAETLPIVETAPPTDPEPRYQAKPGSYDGAELRPYTGRGPEALRAFTLPSLVNGQRVARPRSPIALTGDCQLRDNRGRV